MPDVRLIERWLPIAALSEESVRERRSMTALPPIYYLHVWWARRPLVASRAAIMASLLPANADRDKFMHVLGIHGDPAGTKRKIDTAKRTGEDLGSDPYGYVRAFKYQPTKSEIRALFPLAAETSVLDPTAGGGSIAFETARLGLAALANDLNPVAGLILTATVDYPCRFGSALLKEFSGLSSKLGQRLSRAFAIVYPREPDGRVEGYLWARTITCPYCAGLIPLSPNWRLAAEGLGVKLAPQCRGADGRVCEKKGSDIKLWDSKTRAEKGSLGGADGARSMLDSLHHAAHRARTRSLEASREMLDDSGLSDDPTFLVALEAVLEVLPPSRTFTQVELTGDLKSASDDFDALEKLRRLAFADKVDEPKQLELWAEEAA
jgi:putative DNA methylase